MISPPTSVAGSCVISVPSVPDYFNGPASVQFYVKYDLAFSNVPSVLTPGDNFTIDLATVPSSGIQLTVPVALYCGSSIYQTWPAVTVNSPYATTLAANVPVGSCYMSSSTTSDAFNSATSSSIVIRGDITLTSPTADSVAAGSSVTVSWTSNPIPPTSSVYIVSLTCPNFPAESYNVVDELTFSFPILETLYGLNCVFDVALSNYDCSNPKNLTVTQTASFSAPQEGSTVNLVSNSISVSIVTSGANIQTGITTEFVCASDQVQSSPIITTNTAGQTLAISSTQVGSCTFTMTSWPAYFDSFTRFNHIYFEIFT